MLKMAQLTCVPNLVVLARLLGQITFGKTKTIGLT